MHDGTDAHAVILHKLPRQHMSANNRESAHASMETRPCVISDSRHLLTSLMPSRVPAALPSRLTGSNTLGKGAVTPGRLLASAAAVRRVSEVHCNRSTLQQLSVEARTTD